MIIFVFCIKSFGLFYIIIFKFQYNMEKIVLNAQKRESGENVRDLRQSKVIPAVVYGHKQETISIKLNNSELLRVYRKARENHIVELDID